MDPVASALARTRLGIETIVRNLTMFPLLAIQEPEPHEPLEPPEPYEPIKPVEPLVLDSALSSGWMQVTEVSEAGSVAELRVVNKSDRPVFILDGEELVGARQNRVVNLSLLVPPRCSLTIPVSCVEAGRWHWRSRSFSAAPRAQYAAGRARRMEQVTACLLSVGERRSDQAAVWADISEKSQRLRSHSATAAMEAMFVDHAADIESFVERLVPVPGQVGAVFAVDGRIAGVELLQNDVLLRKLLPKIVRSYALDAIDAAGLPARRAGRGRHVRDRASMRVGASAFLEKVASSEGKRVRAIGLGDDVRIAVSGLTAAALVHEERVVHLSAFAI